MASVLRLQLLIPNPYNRGAPRAFSLSFVLFHFLSPARFLKIMTWYEFQAVSILLKNISNAKWLRR